MLILQALASGLINSLFVAFPVIAVGIVYKHGRYLPLWIADHGALTTYGMHLLMSLGIGLVLGAPIAIGVSFALGYLLYKFIFIDLIDQKARLSALLVSIGIIQVNQVLMSLYGAGKSQHFDLASIVTAPVMRTPTPVYLIDFIALTVLILVGVSLYAFLVRTHVGSQVRLILSNRNLAWHYGLPVARLDALTLLIAILLISLGALLKAIKYDLQPQMMFFTGLTAIVACVVAGQRRWYLAPLVAAGIEIAVSICGVFASVAPYQRSIPFVLVLVYFLITGLKSKVDA